MYYPKLLMAFFPSRMRPSAWPFAPFMIFEPNGLAYRWWQAKNYFNLWPFSY
jgi:branched-chain amino acid transport system permease protein